MEPKPLVYVETTIISYLVARPSRDLIVVAHQRLTQEWWEIAETLYQLVISEQVIQEITAGNSKLAAKRLKVIEELPILELTDEALRLVRLFLYKGVIPEKSVNDAFHIAIAAVHGVDYLVTWNCRHIANARLRPKIEEITRSIGYEPPIICTPEELLEDAS